MIRWRSPSVPRSECLLVGNAAALRGGRKPANSCPSRDSAKCEECSKKTRAQRHRVPGRPDAQDAHATKLQYRPVPRLAEPLVQLRRSRSRKIPHTPSTAAPRQMIAKNPATIRAHQGIGPLTAKPATPPIVNVPSGPGWSGVSASAAHMRPNAPMKPANAPARSRGHDSGNAANAPIAANATPKTITRG